MRKKIIGFSICILVITLVIPTFIVGGEPLTTFVDDVEIKISAGFRGKDFGIDFMVYLLNQKTENVNVFFNVTFDYIFPNVWVFSDEWNETLPPELPYYYGISCVLCTPDGIKFVSITVEAEGIIVTRNGFSIGKLLILFK